MVPFNSKPSKFWGGGMVPSKQKLYKSKGGGSLKELMKRKGFEKTFSVCVKIICIDSEAKGVGVLRGGGVPITQHTNNRQHTGKKTATDRKHLFIKTHHIRFNQLKYRKFVLIPLIGLTSVKSKKKG